MIISHLVLSNYRNQHKIRFEFSSETTIIIGKNASGKTNLLEAIYFLAIGKSFRLGRESQAIIFGQEIARISGTVKTNRDEKKLEVMLTNGEVMGIKTPLKKLMLNGIPKRSVDFVGNLRSVLFWPEDMELVTDSPTLRRRYLDFVLMQTDREYRRTLISYERGVRQRNKLLEAIRDNNAHMHQLIFWDQLLIKQGSYLTEKREEFIDYVNKFELILLTEQGVRYKLFYDKSIISPLRLLQYKNEEVSAGMTLVGPHRDDVIFKIQETKNRKQTKDEFLDLSVFGSRGEQRLAVLWLKLTELSYIEEKTKEKPVLLLDDIFSELDHAHREIIFGMIGHQQSILTVTDRHLIPEIYYKRARVIELKND